MLSALRKATLMVFALVSLGQSAPLVQAATMNAQPVMSCHCDHAKKQCGCPHHPIQKSQKKLGCHKTLKGSLFLAKPCGTARSDDTISFAPEPFLPQYASLTTLCEKKTYWISDAYLLIGFISLPDPPPPRA